MDKEVTKEEKNIEHEVSDKEIEEQEENNEEDESSSHENQEEEKENVSNPEKNQNKDQVTQPTNKNIPLNPTITKFMGSENIDLGLTCSFYSNINLHVEKISNYLDI